ncbi:DUF2971 domain-containing protein [Kiritimatiellota bacterium B12222]|nr:DUF2971 domain-containing protein [Kiritimatiellota bacterium B12222]
MKLYKYCSYSHYLLGCLTKKTIWLSGPEAFNDIFDCKFDKVVLTVDQVEEIRAVLQHRVENGGDEHFVSEDLPPKIHTTEELKHFVDSQYELVENFIKGFGIMSMSELSDSILLWAHYGDNHRGVCLEYDIPDLQTNPLMTPESIIYSTQYPTLSLYDFWVDILSNGSRILKTKSIEWSYEKEWRILLSNSANSEISTPFELTAVIFGARMPDNEKETIKAILKRDEGVKLLQAFESTNSFTLTISNQTAS